MLDSFIVNAVLAGSLIAIIGAPIGTVMIFQRLSYFGDAMSHNALLGIALGVFLGMSSLVAVFVVTLLTAVLFFLLYEKNIAKSDTLLAIISQIGLALGIIAVAYFGAGNNRIMGFLFGDILTVGRKDVIMIAVLGAVIFCVLAIIWNKLLILSFDKETAMAENGKMSGVKIAFMFVLALFVALAIKCAGVLLVTALLIIPAVGAKFVAKVPETMVMFAALFGTFAVWVGMFVSYFFDVSTAPIIVVCAAGITFFAYLLKKVKK